MVKGRQGERVRLYVRRTILGYKSGIAVSMVMKYADNIVKVYSTSVAMLLTAVVSVFLFGFNLTLAFFLGDRDSV
ncbi:CMP-sialic acid transporter 2-like isoform X6 [Gossypium arboreum]|uniref:CMP-sialic acid transporter 2-like isoform X6 n=1 Tax=Gossypium arboreum TaxID=29729 RepID=UPI0008193131|nr:CMP-sialic acid transporter 2-like isoform X6 [Gossypium arboreum]